MKKTKFETMAIHAGQEADRLTGAVTVPVYQTSTYKQDGIGKTRGGYEYSRTGNPTRAALETALAALEGGSYGLSFSSGLAAIAAVLELLKPGDHVLACDDLYGGTWRLFEKVYRKWGLSFTYVPAGNSAELLKAIQPNTRLLWLETPTNPLLCICDIKAAGAAARRAGARLVVDNTFATPYFQRPLELGADIVVHSVTKYLGGHCDVVGGAVITRDKAAFEGIKFHQNAAGAVPGPWDCWLVLRGLKTLPVRMRAHETAASFLAEQLSRHPKVARVYYPGLKSHPGHRLAKAQMSGFGGMLAVDLKGGVKAVERFLSRLEIFTLAESLGGVESLACYPSKMTHGSLSEADRRARGIGDNLVRLSAGLEDPRDLLEDIKRGLE